MDPRQKVTEEIRKNKAETEIQDARFKQLVKDDRFLVGLNDGMKEWLDTKIGVGFVRLWQVLDFKKN